MSKRNFDKRYSAEYTNKPAKPIMQDGHAFVSQGCGQYRCTRCNLQTFLPAATLPRCKPQEK